MPKTSRQLLRSVYRLIISKQSEEAKACAWEALKEDIEEHLVDTWEPETFITVQSILNEKCNVHNDRNI